MKPVVLFVVGAPGIGKTTFVRTMLGMNARGELPFGGFLNPKPKWTITAHYCAAGHYTGQTFDGTDTIPYTGAMEALGWWRQALVRGNAWTRDAADKIKPVILEGARTASRSMLEWLQAGDSDVRCLHMVAEPDLLQARRASRQNSQNATWMRGRETAAANFAQQVLKVRHVSITAHTTTRDILTHAHRLLDG